MVEFFRELEFNHYVISGLLLGLACATVGALVTFVVMLYRVKDEPAPPPDDGNPFVLPLPPAPDYVPEWMEDQHQ